MVKKALMLLEEASVRLATRHLYMKAKKDFLWFCDSLSPLVNVDDPCTAGAALCAYAIALLACGHHKPHFERNQVAFSVLFPEFGYNRTVGSSRTYRAMKGFRLRCPGRFRKPHQLIPWQNGARSGKCYFR